MRQVEIGAGDDAFWQAHPPQTAFTVEVADLSGQDLPFSLTAVLPVRGLFGLFQSPISVALTPDPTWIPVFSAPARPVPAATAVVRAQLKDTVNGIPAAWAFLTIQSPGQPDAAGMTDERGIAAIQFAYPEPRNFAIGSPLKTGGIKWTDQSWPITVRVQYSPGRGDETRPDLHQTLGQPPAVVNPGSFTLQAGQELLLRSTGSGGRELSDLFVTPAGSPL
jgi:hypothetical protein